MAGSRVMAIHHITPTPTPTPTLTPQFPSMRFNLLIPPHLFTIPSHRAFRMSATATPIHKPIHPHHHGWTEFAQNISGEWDGFGADFTSDGNPIELPENVVPDAYREWEVKVFDWQTQCPTLAQEQDSFVIYKIIKLLPTVGCEADAATRFSVDERKIGGKDNMVSAFAYQSNGCYTAVWSKEKEGSFRVLELEHCLIDPRDKESRVRIIQVVAVEGNSTLTFKNMRVFVEQWYGPFRNGEQLGGCAIRDSAFASTQVLNTSQVVGVWRRTNSVASFRTLPSSIIQELVVDDRVEKLARDENNLIMLPKKLWASMKEMEDGEACCEVGWLLEAGRAITSKCVFFRNTELKEIIMSFETADTD